ncbi:MAG: hypothetical protein ABIH72_01230 [archaeon]
MKLRKLGTKRGGVQLTMNELIALIIVIISFLVLLGFWYFLGFEHQINGWWCHFSVILRGTLNQIDFLTGNAGKYIPISCQTEKVCIGMGGGGCKGMIGTSKNPIKEVKVSGDDVQVQGKILEKIAESMYECNSALGEGKVNWGEGKISSQNYCVICSRIGFDSEVQDKIDNIPYSQIFYTLQEKKDSRENSYLSQIYPGVNSWLETKQSQQKIIEENSEYKNSLKDENNDGKIDVDDWMIDLDNENGYVIVSQLAKPGYIKELVGTVAVTGLALTVVGAPVAVLAAGGIAIWYNNKIGNSEYSYQPPALVKFDIKELNNLKCTEFASIP